MTSFLGPAVLAGEVLPGVGLDPLLAVLSAATFGMGLADVAAGLAERLGGGDAGTGDDSGNDDPFGGDFEDEFGGGQFGEETFEDDFGEGGFDDWEDDDGDMGGLDGGGGPAGLEPRIEELEDEVANISSTVSTVRSENQAINESVEDIEDNIRQLLDIYEMVTRGVNPFVDDVAGGGTEGSFGLFEDSDDDFDDLDPEVAEADPDSFFEDDFAGEDVDGAGEDPFAEEADPLDEEDDPFDEPIDSAEGSGALEEPSAEPTGSVGGGDGGGEADDDGKTFEQLKSEYESGGMDWQSEGGNDGPPEDETADVARGAADEGTADSTGSHDEGGGPADGPSDAEAASTDGGADANTAESGGKPYLEELPDGYATELLVIEWLSYLRSRSSTSEALRAIRYYETIDWIGPRAAEALTEYLTGLADGNADVAPGDGTQLTIDHHTHSLRYIGRLGGADVEVERLDWPSPSGGGARLERGEQRGIQR